MKPKLCLETTIPSYLTAWGSRELVMAAHQQLTREWWEGRRADFDLYFSVFVLDEARAGDPAAARRRLEALAPFPLLAVDDRVTALATRLLKDCRLPTRATIDSLHLAVAAVHAMDYFLTWNCAHLANAELIPKVRAVCEAAGHPCPAICTPEELMGT
jgi:hypothetical protein